MFLLLARTVRDAEVIYFPLWFFFFRHLISEVTERISTKFGHIFTYDCYLKNLVRTPHGLNRFLGTDFEILPNISRLGNVEL